MTERGFTPIPQQAPVSMYNTAEYRRRMYSSMIDADWLDYTNQDAKSKRDHVNETVIADMVTFLQEHENGVVIMDSTNPTHERRDGLLKKLQAQTGAKVMFIEVINEDVDFLNRQYADTVALNPDYAGQSPSLKVMEYRSKVDRFRAFYEPLDAGATHDTEHKYTYMKCDHAVQNFVVNRARGYLQQKVVNFIMNLRTTRHSFYLTRHGQSVYNDFGRIGGDSGLSEHGVKYAEKLAQFVEDVITKDANGNEIPTRLWTSTMRRTKETTQFIKQKTLIVKPDPADPSQDFEWVQMRPRAWHHLDELFAGSCDGMTYEEIEEKFPEEWKLRAADKLAYRYPRGESYLDVIARLEPIIIEMERHQEPLLIVAHQGILRIIYAFYMGHTRAEAPFLSIPLNEVVELCPGPVICTEKRHPLYCPEAEMSSDGQDEPGGRGAHSHGHGPGMQLSHEHLARMHDPPSH